MRFAKFRMEQKTSSEFTRDRDIHIFSRNVVSSLARSSVAILLLILLFVPIVLLMVVQTTSQRIAILFVSCSVFVVIISTLVKTKASETFLAGAA